MSQTNSIPLDKDRLKEMLDSFNPPKTQVELANYLEITPRSLNRYLNQGRINKDNLIKIGKFLDCNPSYLSGNIDVASRYSSYEQWHYTINDCISGLLIKRGFSPRDFSGFDFSRLFLEMSVVIERYATQNNIKHVDESENRISADNAVPQSYNLVKLPNEEPNEAVRSLERAKKKIDKKKEARNGINKRKGW